MLHLETRALNKEFGSFRAVSDVSVSFAPGQIHAVLGENGAGKSTLMKLLFGLLKPTSGEILLEGRAMHWSSPMDAIENGLGMVQQHFSLVDSLSAIDNIMLGAERASLTGHLNRAAVQAELEALLPSPHLAVPWNALVSELSVGLRQRIEILKLLFRKSKILFLDEPTAVLTPQEIEDFFEVLRALKAAGRTIVLITHKIGEVFSLCDTYAVLRRGKMIASGLVRDVTREQLVENMIGRKLEPIRIERMHAKAETALLAKHLSDGSVGHGCMRDISLEIHAGEILGIAGIDGSGQSNFVDAILGLRGHQGELRVLGHEPHSAKVIRELGVGLIPEDRLTQGLWPDETCYHNMVIGLEDDFTHAGCLNESEIEKATSGWAKQFDVRAAALTIPVGSLSGGNQQKIIFAREVLGRKPKLLICHQPTRGVDLGAIDLIHRKILELRNQGIAVLLISSELDELLALSDRITVFFDGKTVAQFEPAEFDRFQIGAAMTGAGQSEKPA
jgi:ABC-type uncharacterized transport system ATPase subunit